MIFRDTIIWLFYWSVPLIIPLWAAIIMGFVIVVSLYLFKKFALIFIIFSDVNFKEIFELTDRGK
jgi:hypothetical protein